MDEFDFSYALDKLVLGVEKERKVSIKDVNWRTAIHEAGHALVAHYTKGSSTLNKLTILSRGKSLGHVSLNYSLKISQIFYF